MKQLKTYLTSWDFTETVAFVGAYIAGAGLFTSIWWAHHTHASSLFAIFG
jgi:hypothetical protein